MIKLVVDRLSKSGGEAGAKGVCFLAWGAGAGKLVKGISPVSRIGQVVTRQKERGMEEGKKAYFEPAFSSSRLVSVQTAPRPPPTWPNRLPQRAHHILTSAHPSPLSAARGFMGNGHFKKCNDWLEQTYGEGKGIDWTSVEKEE